MDKLKVGIVGCGHVSQVRHIPGFLRLKKSVELSAICDLDINLAKKVGRKFGVKNVYSNLSDMLSKESLDVVDVCTPPKVHTSVALESMKNGCNVLLEKPMAPSLQECDKMVEAHKKYGVRLSVMHNQNFYPPLLKARDLVNDCEIGELLGMRVLILTPKHEYISHQSHWIHNLPGGVIGETGPHAVYMSLPYTGYVEDVTVNARRKSSFSWVSYDDYRIELIGKNLTSSIYVSHASDCNASEVDFFGTKGLINADLQSMVLTRHKRQSLNPSSVATSSLSLAGQTAVGVFSNVVKFAFGKSMLGHYIMIEKFIESIKNKTDSPVTAEEGRECMRVMELISEKLSDLKTN